jgi:hypothetical protein
MLRHDASDPRFTCGDYVRWERHTTERHPDFLPEHRDNVRQPG